MYAAELLLSDKPLPHPWFGKTGYSADKSRASQWFDAHDLIARSPAGDGSMVWTRKGELYRARIRAAHITHITDLWQWAKDGNGPSVWHGVTNGQVWT
jgi:hypothetical protein